MLLRKIFDLAMYILGPIVMYVLVLILVTKFFAWIS